MTISDVAGHILFISLYLLGCLTSVKFCWPLHLVLVLTNQSLMSVLPTSKYQNKLIFFGDSNFMPCASNYKKCLEGKCIFTAFRNNKHSLHLCYPAGLIEPFLLLFFDCGDNNAVGNYLLNGLKNILPKIVD